ncbi:MAG: hypothetical protein S4CHLAM2_08690 [Chlamydiales bacterium]|nr:hypothetical protein [Chlamydiales bacterium]
MFKRIFFLCCLLLLIGAALFPHEILVACVKYQASRYCRKAWGGKFTYESLNWEEGRVVCKNGALVKTGQIHVSFAHAYLSPSFHWKTRELGGLVELEGVKIVSRKTEPQKLSYSSLPRLPFFSFCFKTRLKSGEVALYDSMGVAPLLQRFYFDLEHTIKNSEINGSIILNLEEQEEKLPIYFQREKEGIVRLQTDFQSHSLPSLYHLMIYFFHSHMPQSVKHWQLQKGKIEGALDLTLLEGEPLHMNGKLTCSKVHAANAALELFGEVDRAQANLEIDFTSVKTMYGEISLDGGRLALEESREFWQGIWDLSHLTTNICVRDGKVESSVLHGSFMGMEGELVFDWHSPDALMRMGFEGNSQDMSFLFPTPLQESFRKAFTDDHFVLDASLHRAGRGLELEGNLIIAGEERHQLDFGCLFGVGMIEVEVVPEALPHTLSNSVDSFLDHLAQQFCLSQKRFGWFHGKHFPLEKFLSPFLFRDVNMEASGQIHFDGTFDERYLVFSYEGEDFLIESPNFSLQTARIEKEIAKDVAAVHYFDLQTWDHVGFLPLKDTVYQQKNKRVTFTEGEAVVHFENEQIHILDVETKWADLTLKGELEIEMHALDDVDLVMSAHSIEGPASDAQKLLAHFSHSIFWEIPFEGNVRGEGDVFSFHYHFTPEVDLVAGQMHGFFEGNFKNSPLFCAGEVRYDLNEILLNVDSPHASFTGSIGKTISLEGDEIVFHAVQDEGEMHILDFKYKTWEGEGDIEWDTAGVHISHLSIQETESEQGACVLSGCYNRVEKIFEGQIDQFHWTFGDTFSLWKPQGEIFGDGKLEWTREEGLQAQLAGAFRKLKFGGIQFGDGEDLRCFYSSKRGLSVEGLAVEIPTEMGVETYKLGCFTYHLSQQKIQCEGFDFSLPPEKLPWVAELAGKLFPGKVHPTIVDWVEALKQNEPLEGKVSFEVYPDTVWVYLDLKDGTYHLSDHQFRLKNFLLLYDPVEINLWTQCLYRDNYYWLHMLTDSMTMGRGQLAISENALSPRDPAGQDSLIASWERQNGKGWRVQKVQGNFHGLQMDLVAENLMDFSDSIALQGRIGVDASRVHPLLGDQLAHLVDRFSVAGGYTLEGGLAISKSDFSLFSFNGALTGTDICLGNVELSSLNADLYYTPDWVALSNLMVKDWAGQLSVSQLDLVKNVDSWAFLFDQLKLEDVRISRLRSPWTNWEPRSKPFYRSFFIRSFELSQFQGYFDDASSVVGKGKLAFTNLPKKTFLSNLLFIPTEITARIGLDLAAFVPVRGTIDYEIKEGKIYLNEFKDMFSDGKLSRFYLAEGSKAYVDFGGNLNLKMKMKQYNLLMKLAEFFTISVKGTLLNPKYSFSNQFEDD